MKKLIFLVSIYLLAMHVSFSQIIEEIPLFKEKSGLYYFDASINGVKGKFLFDTGASGVSVNPSFLDSLKTSGVISQKDYLRSAVVIGVNNTSVNVDVYKTNSLSFDNFTISDLEIFVMPDSNSKLIIGQSVFEKFGIVSLDTKNSVLRITKNFLKINEIKFIPCSISKILDIPPLARQINKIVNPNSISEEQNVPPPAKAVARVNNGITIRYFGVKSKDVAIALKNELKKSDDYKNIDIITENMLPFIPNQIKSYIEIWIK